MSSEIAIIGMSGRFPESPNVEKFWDNLINSRDLIKEVPKDRWDWKNCFGDPKKNENKTDSKWGGFLDDVKSFDADFFRISPREADKMDPQQRIIMEEVWKTIEDAGYKPSFLSGTKTGVFIGASNNDYIELLQKEGVHQDAYVSSGSHLCMISNRVSYFLNLNGPSLVVDTACSASLVAVHQAVCAIQNKECTMAIAGGVNLCLIPRKYFSLSHAGMLSPDGRCKTFDKKANGFVKAEGAGIILLKPLKKAIEDGDHIYGIIRGTALNHNGFGGFEHSLTASNSEAQAQLLISAYEDANLSPDTITFIEAHGTATALGDPFEIAGLKKAFKTLYNKWNLPEPKTPHCAIGSVKSNIGHTEPAAGITGLIKILLAMKHKKIPANLHINELNPRIRLDKTPFYIVKELEEWKQLIDEKGIPIPRRAGVSSFGFGGANAHVVIEEYENKQEHIDNNKQYIIVLSAKNEEILKIYAKNMVDFLEKNKDNILLSNIAYTLQIGRESMSKRLAFVAHSINDLIIKLNHYCNGKYNSELYDDEIVNLWLSGEEVNWDLLYTDSNPKRIPLPTYPFEKKKYWYDSSIKKTIIQPQIKLKTLKTKNSP
ncbi:MAG: type I polyketide synthase [Desulfobacterales bacterium]|nr:type I polyketide synthase [Desulfobacterales bacterium]